MALAIGGQDQEVDQPRHLCRTAHLGPGTCLSADYLLSRRQRNGLIQQNKVLLRAEQIGLLTAVGQRWAAEEEVLRGWGEKFG